MRAGDILIALAQVALVALAVLWGWAMSAAAASADEAVAPPCGPWPEWEAVLAERWGEAAAWVGLAPDGRQLILTQTSDGTTWSLLVLDQAGACLAADGIAWAVIEPPLPGEES